MDIQVKASKELLSELKKELEEKITEKQEKEFEYYKLVKKKNAIEKTSLSISNQEGSKDKYMEFFNIDKLENKISQLHSEIVNTLPEEIWYFKKTIEELE